MYSILFNIGLPRTHILTMCTGESHFDSMGHISSVYTVRKWFMSSLSKFQLNLGCCKSNILESCNVPDNLFVYISYVEYTVKIVCKVSFEVKIFCKEAAQLGNRQHSGTSSALWTTELRFDSQSHHCMPIWFPVQPCFRRFFSECSRFPPASNIGLLQYASVCSEGPSEKQCLFTD